MRGLALKIASLSKARSGPSSMSLPPWLLGRKMDRMSRTRERYQLFQRAESLRHRVVVSPLAIRLFQRAESLLRRARVPRGASDWLAGLIIGDGLRLRGGEAEVEGDGGELAAPRRFVS